MSHQVKPPSPFSRMLSLIRTGPRALLLRFYDQGMRRLTGSPVWWLSRITPQLYIGGQHRDIVALEKEGITVIVNLRESHHNDVAKGIAGKHHLHLPTRDNTPPTLEDLEQAADFIAKHTAQDQKIYVHCGVGVGRAPTAAAGYLIKYQHLSAIEALRLMRRTRPFVHLTSRQFQQLVAFEERHHHPELHNVEMPRIHDIEKA